MPPGDRRTMLLGLPLLLLAACHDEDASLFDRSVVERCYEEALVALDEGAGIRLIEPVEIVVLTADEAAERRAAYAAGLDEDRAMTAAMDGVADLVFSDNMLGRYLPDEKVVYIVEDVLLAQAGSSERRALEELFPVLAHELVHAYDDQAYGALPLPSDLEELMLDTSRLPELQALMGLIEGRATYASELACLAANRRPLPVLTLERAREATLLDGDGSLGGDLLAGMANSVARLKLVQYAQGRQFARDAYTFGGEPFFAQVFSHLPLSLAELEDFEVFKQRWVEELAASLDDEDLPDEAEDGEP